MEESRKSTSMPCPTKRRFPDVARLAYQTRWKCPRIDYRTGVLVRDTSRVQGKDDQQRPGRRMFEGPFVRHCSSMKYISLVSNQAIFGALLSVMRLTGREILTSGLILECNGSVTSHELVHNPMRTTLYGE